SFSSIRKNLGKPPPFFKAGRFLLWLGWIVDSVISALRGKPATLTRSLMKSAAQKQEYSNRKLVDAIGFRFTPIDEHLKLICANYIHDHKPEITRERNR